MGAHKGRRQSSGRETWAKFKSHQIRSNGTVPSPPNHFFVYDVLYITPDRPPMVAVMLQNAIIKDPIHDALRLMSLFLVPGQYWMAARASIA